MPSRSFFARFLRFIISHLWRLGSWQRAPRCTRTRNASKQGISERFGVFVPLELVVDTFGKKRLGAAELRSFWKCRFSHFSGRGPTYDFFGSQVCRVWVRVRLVAENGLWLRCRGFLRFLRGCSFDAVFANLKTISSNSPPFFSCFIFFCVFFLGLGSTQPCTCVFEPLALNVFLFWA